MKRLLCLCLLLMGLTATAATDKGEEDFASRFLTLHATAHELDCKTISPQMMERIMQLETGDTDDATRRVLAQIKSIRIVTGGGSPAEGLALFQKAGKLAALNRRRYTVDKRADDVDIYTRRHGKKLVELVVVRLKEEGMFYLLDITGNMSDDFGEQVLGI